MVSPFDLSWREGKEGLPCSLCDCLLFGPADRSSSFASFPIMSDAKYYSTLFHGPCESCSQDVDSSDCCAFCQHLRIRHLFLCLPKDTFLKEYDFLESFAIKLGSVATLESRKRCPLCRFFHSILTVRYRLWQQRTPWGNNTIILEFSENGPFLRMSSGKPEPWRASDHSIYSLDESPKVRFSTHEIRKQSSTPRNLSSKVNWITLHQWMRNYMHTASLPQSEDLGSQHTSTPRLPQPLLVIDVRNSCIVSKPTGYTYAALSYVWGNPTRGEVQATLANISDLEKPGALKQGGIPLTILDAMAVAFELDIPYLWVDRLCIVQDDPTTKHDLINQMNSIYANALVTFVAGGGKDASYGLPGVSNTRSPGQAQIRIQGIELTEVLPKFCDDILPRMTWMERGWTYQEALFSANLMFFTDYGVFYDSMSTSREVLAEPPNPHDESLFSTVTDFFRSVEAYSGRKLTYETDIEKAFSGVLQSFHGEEHAYGSPLRFFDSAIRWIPKNSLKPRRSTNNDTFPSWSWLSVKGKVDFSHSRFSIASLPIATWAMMLPTADGESQLRFIGFDRYGESEIDPRTLDQAWNSGFFKGKSRPQSSADAHLHDVREGYRRDWNTVYSTSEPYEYYWSRIRGLESASAPAHLLFPMEYHHRLRPGQVLVHTRSARLRKLHPQRRHPWGWGLRDVQKDIQRHISDLWGVTILIGEDFDLNCLCKDLEELTYVDAIALSITDRDSVDLGRWGIGRVDEPLRLTVDVMLIRRVGGVAYRVALGWMSLKKWIKAKPASETIVLG